MINLYDLKAPASADAAILVLFAKFEKQRVKYNSSHFALEEAQA
jgi:hypothetical protein